MFGEKTNRGNLRYVRTEVEHFTSLKKVYYEFQNDQNQAFFIFISNKTCGSQGYSTITWNRNGKSEKENYLYEIG